MSIFMWEDTTVVIEIILQSLSEEFQKKSFKIPFKCLNSTGKYQLFSARRSINKESKIAAGNGHV